jgi:hypothetical protein
MSKPIVQIFNAKVENNGVFDYLSGRVLGHPRVKDGHKINSSKIISIDCNLNRFETLNTIYEEKWLSKADQLIFNLIDEIIERIGGL